METVKERLKQLKLSGALRALESRHRYALDQKLSYVDFLELLLEDEWTLRQNNGYKRRLQQSKLNEQKQNVVYMGKPGVGKTHLANALGLEALSKVYILIRKYSTFQSKSIPLINLDGYNPFITHDKYVYKTGNHNQQFA